MPPRLKSNWISLKEYLELLSHEKLTGITDYDMGRLGIESVDKFKRSFAALMLVISNGFIGLKYLN